MCQVEDLMLQAHNNAIKRWLANFFRKGQDSKYFRLVDHTVSSQGLHSAGVKEKQAEAACKQVSMQCYNTPLFNNRWQDRFGPRLQFTGPVMQGNSQES